MCREVSSRARAVRPRFGTTTADGSDLAVRNREEPDWMERVGPRNEMEEDMLDFAFDVRENSRLSCQIKITDALDGLTVKVPEKQF